MEFLESADYVFMVDEQAGTCTIHKSSVVNNERLTWGDFKVLYR